MNITGSILRCAAAILLVCLVSCGLFETRDPAEPEPSDVNCLALNNVNNVRTNIESSYGRLALRACYESLLDAAFRFHPDPQDSLQNPDAFANWDKVAEASHNTRVGDNTFIFVDLNDTLLSSPDIDTEVRRGDYVVRVRGLATDTTAIVRYAGRADLIYKRGQDGLWRIVDWADHRTGASDTSAGSWGLLRSEQPR